MKQTFSPVVTLLTLAATLVTGPIAQAQPLDRGATPSRVAMGDEVFKLESIGFSMPMTQDCHMVLDHLGAFARGYFFPPDRAWTIRVETIRSSQGLVTRQEFAEHLINKVLLAHGRRGPDGTAVNSLASILATEQNLNIDLGPASRFYARFPQVPNPRTKEDWIVRGRTIVQMVPTEAVEDDPRANFKTDQFLVLTLECTEPNFTQARSIYETLVSAATMTDPSDLNQARGAMILTGQRFLDGLNPNDFAAAIGSGIDEWERLYIPSSTGAIIDDTEVGFRHTKAEFGSLADVPELGGDNQQGYIVRVQARYFIPSQNAVADTESVMFVSQDLLKETWFVKTAVYDRQSRTLIAQRDELGARDNQRMNIQVSGKGIKTEHIKPIIEGDGYISRAVIMLLPKLLVHRQAPADYGFYHYRSLTGTITFRSDSLGRDPSNPDIWRIKSLVSADEPPQVTYLTEDGRTLRSELTEGRVWVPIEVSELLNVWKRKNLPTGTLAAGG